MKRDWSKIAAVVSCILLVICLMQIGSLKKEIQNLQNNLSNRISGVEYSVNNISSGIYHQLEREASLLSGSEWIYGDMNLEDYTILLRCSVSPKEYQPEMTEAVLVSEETEYPMKLENGAYTADIWIPLFEESQIKQVQFREAGVVRTEQLDWHLSPREQGVMNVYADFSGGTSFGKDGDIFSLDIDGTVHLYTERKGDHYEIEKVYLVEKVDEKEIAREEIQVEQKSAMDYEFPLNKKVELPFGSTYDLYVEVVDHYGLHHRNWLEHKTVDMNGEFVEDREWWHGMEGSIYDEQGNPLYVINENGAASYVEPAATAPKEPLEIYRDFVRKNYDYGITSTLLSDLTDDGEQELIVVSNYVVGEDGTPLSEDTKEAKELRELDQGKVGYHTLISMKVYTQKQDGSVACLYQESASSPHPGWNWLYLYEENGKDYLFKFSPSMWQGMGTYEYEIFSLTDSGEKKMLHSDAEEYVLPEEGTPEYEELWERMQQFLEQVHHYQEAGTPLIEIGEDLFDTKDAASGPREYNYVINCDELGIL